MSNELIDDVTAVDAGRHPGSQDDGWFVAVRASGRTGWYGPVRRAVAVCARTVVAPRARGLPVDDHQRLLRRFAEATSRPCRELSWAIGAVDCAMWDLRATAAGVSVAALLAREAPSDAVPAYASWLRLDVGDPDSAAQVAATATQGWAFTKWGLRAEPHTDTSMEADRLTALASCAWEAAGAAVAFDALGTWTPALAAAFAASTPPAGLVWVEDPSGDPDDPACTAITASGLPLAIGERLLLGQQPQGLLAARPRALTVDVVGCGGITRATELLDVAKAHGIPMYPHGRSLIPALHLAAAHPEVIPAVEYQVQWEPGRQQLRAHSAPDHRGRIALPDTAGLGASPRSL